jgi:predicted PurR-regulated permease PerM
MPDFLVLLATLGGLASFGFNGLLIGPVAAGLFLSAWQSRTVRPR